MQENDLVLRFGDITLDTNPDGGLSQPAKIVPDAAAAQTWIQVVEQRGDGNAATTTTTTIELKPRPWEGRGLGGCHIVPSKLK